MTAPKPKPQSFTDVIALWPLIRLFAEDVGVSATRAYQWQARRKIPSSQWDAVIEAARHYHGVALSRADFYGFETAARRLKQDAA
jgi:hypothetical protein